MKSPSKDTWQPFTATRDRTSADPTVVLPLLVMAGCVFTGHSLVALFFYFFDLIDSGLVATSVKCQKDYLQNPVCYLTDNNTKMIKENN